MAKKETTGQMNMFDLLNEEVQMVSLMPDDELIDDAISAGITGGYDDSFDLEPEELYVPEPDIHLSETLEQKPVMQRRFTLSGNSVDAVVSYLDYNKVYVKEPGLPPEEKQFEQAMEAVDYYISKIQELKKDGVMTLME